LLLESSTPASLRHPPLIYTLDRRRDNNRPDGWLGCCPRLPRHQSRRRSRGLDTDCRPSRVDARPPGQSASSGVGRCSSATLSTATPCRNVCVNPSALAHRRCARAAGRHWASVLSRPASLLTTLPIEQRVQHPESRHWASWPAIPFQNFYRLPSATEPDSPPGRPGGSCQLWVLGIGQHGHATIDPSSESCRYVDITMVQGVWGIEASSLVSGCIH
jgi:hypothetical protein